MESSFSFNLLPRQPQRGAAQFNDMMCRPAAGPAGDQFGWHQQSVGQSPICLCRHTRNSCWNVSEVHINPISVVDMLFSHHVMPTVAILVQL